ncbi:hypothetical protein ACWEOE_10655 [Amycolatopsis sp. NPDC004368]
MLARLFSKLIGRDREAGPEISDGVVDLLVEMAKFERPDREAGPLASREAVRTYERAGLGTFL